MYGTYLGTYLQYLPTVHTCTYLVMRLWYRSPFYFSLKSSAYLVFTWLPRSPKLWKLSTHYPDAEVNSTEFEYLLAISTVII